MFLEKVTFFCIFLLLSIKCSWASRIQYYGGEYRNILVAISPKINVSRCQSLISEIQTSLAGTSAKLNAVTDGRVYFSTIKILIPREWGPDYCGSSQAAEASSADTYTTADIKVTENHPLARSLPYTSQFKGCGQGGEDIFIPPDFLVSPDFSPDQKSQLLLHEWSKFRYGVYEEFGFFGDETYPACYVRQASLQFTSCSSTVLEPLTNVTSGDCQSEVNGKATELRNQLTSATSSLMSMPHLENISRFCTETNHNGFAPTKQNAHCSRRSISEVINSHPDFTSNYDISSKNLKVLPPQFEIIRHNFNEFTPGYAFLIEDTAFIREESRLRHVKQAITQMIDMMGNDARAAICTFSGSVVKGPQFVSMNTDANKQYFMGLLPDLNTAPFYLNLTSFTAKQAVGNNNLHLVFQEVLGKLSETKSHKWNLFLITSTPSTSIQEARDLLHGTAHSLSVLTFDGSDSWLQLYTTPNTKNVMVLPNCILNGNVCSTKASYLAVDEFVELMRFQDVPRFLEKVAQAEVELGGQNWFTVEPTASVITMFFIYFPVFTDTTTQIQFNSPSGISCTGARVFNYGYILKMNSNQPGCGYQSGNWSVNLSSLPADDVKYTIQAFAESVNELNRFNIRTSLGVASNMALTPNSQLTPIYARVMDLLERPVIDAEVGLIIHTPSLSASKSFQETLKDDGIDPDLTKNDGVYSTYLRNYSSSPAYHIGQLSVTSIASQTRSIVSLRNTNEYSAALLDSKLSTKCCGSSIPVADTIPAASARYSALLLGFKTAENFDSEALPPSKIGNIKITEDDGIFVTLEYTAPGATINTGTVDHYESCCTVYDSSSLNIKEHSCLPVEDITKCLPVDAGQLQTCILDRDSLTYNYLENVTIIPLSTQNQTFFLYCGIRGVNDLMITGPNSNSLVEIGINIEPYVCNPVVRTLKCDSISDDCLPIVVFWGLIGCIGGLVIVILAIIVCWCWNSRRNNTKNSKPKEEVLMKMNHREPKMPDKDSPLYNVYVNKAYIQETDGQMKLVAAEGELFPFETNEHEVGLSNKNISVPIPSVRRRSVSAELRDHDHLRNPGMDDTRMYKSYLGNKPLPPPKPNSSTFLPSRSAEDLHFAPVPKNRYPKMDSGYANSNNNNNPRSIPISTISSSKHDAPDGDMVPIYASVNRNGRKVYPNVNSTIPVQPLASMLNHNNNSTFQRHKSRNDGLSNSSTFPREEMPIQNRFSRPLSSQSQPPQSLPSTRPSSARLDAFPSSDSESYSDMSRGVPVLPTPPPVPPPFPNKNSENNSSQTLIRNSPVRQNIQPSAIKTMGRTPVRESGLSSPLGPPPPPPPPRQSGHVPNTNANKHQNSDSEYDDDSEHWDDEDFEFTPGDSYA